MVYVGRTNRLQVVRTVDFGLYLDGDEYGDLLLPKRYVPQVCNVGDWLHVFVYADSDDQLIATTETPKAMVGECAYLKVRQRNEVGTFLDWGLTKDLLVPFNEQSQRMHPGRSYVVYVYLDAQSNRIAASTKLSRHLAEDGRDFVSGQSVRLMIAARTELGYKVVIENTHLGLIFASDVFQPLKLGQQLGGYIKSIRPDGKIDVSLQASSDEVRDDLEEEILRHLRANDGVTTITDRSPPDLIYKIFKTSKANFKRALGRLYKKRQVLVEKYKVTLID